MRPLGPAESFALHWDLGDDSTHWRRAGHCSRGQRHFSVWQHNSSHRKWHEYILMMWGTLTTDVKGIHKDENLKEK